MNTKKIQQNYDKLRHDERFRLTLAAYERNDDSELATLTRTAPKETYRMIVPEYSRQFAALDAVAGVVVNKMLHDGWVMVLAWGMSQARPDYDDDADLPFERDVIMAQVVVEGWDTLVAFCDEIGVTVDQALMAVFPRELLESTVVDFARERLESHERLMQIITEVHCRETEQDAEVITAERAENRTTQHDTAVSEYVDMLREAWEDRLR